MASQHSMKFIIPPRPRQADSRSARPNPRKHSLPGASWPDTRAWCVERTAISCVGTPSVPVSAARKWPQALIWWPVCSGWRHTSFDQLVALSDEEPERTPEHVNLLNRQKDQNQRQDSVTAGTNCCLRKSQRDGRVRLCPNRGFPRGSERERDLSVRRESRFPWRNNQLPEQQVSQALARGVPRA